MSRYPRRTLRFVSALALLAGLLTTVAVAPASAVSTELLMTQYVEGSGFNKAVEISNLTASSVDLSTYTLELYSNGSATVSQSVALAGPLAAGDVYVVSHASANVAIQGVTDLTSSGVANWNGDDAIVLRNGTDVVDVFGQVGIDPGSFWGIGTFSTQNNTLCRNSGIENGDTNGGDLFDPSIEWTGQGNDVIDGLGVVGCVDAPEPDPTLIFTQYIEGSANNKAYEIANLTGADVDLSTYVVEVYNNGGSTPNNTQAFSGVLADGEVYVVANANASAAIQAAADIFSTTTFFNGDDALVLRNGNDVVDAFGQVGFDPGTAWGLDSFSTVNNTLCRNDDVRFGDTNATDAFDPSIEWTGLGQDVTTGLGEVGCEGEPPPVEVVKIHEIQGSGPFVAISGPVRVEAIVTSLFERDDALDGFFIQEEDADADADPATSEGIFVFCRGNCAPVAVGDLVTIDGNATDFFGMSQIDIGFGSGTATIVSSGNPLPAATAVLLPAAGSTVAEATFENIEGMVVSFPGALAVSEYFQLARFGQLVLTDTSRPYQFTHDNTPSVAGYAAFLDDLATRRIILDDDSNDNNDAISDGPDEAFFYPRPGLSTTNKVRGGDTISGLTGVLHWSFAGSGGTDAWRIRPIDGVDYTFTPVNEATAAPDDVGGSLTVASFNVLNYFATVDDGPNVCGPDADQDCRGADSEAERIRQRDKIVAAIAAMDADVVGLIELQNDGADESIIQLVDGLNATLGAGTYDYIPTGFIGEDAIKVGYIYQPATATPINDYVLMDQSVDPTYLDSKNRPALIQTFADNVTDERVTVAVNHLKSKGSSCDDVGDPGLDDGQASCAGTRTAAAAALATYMATDPTNVGDPDSLIIGDLNSYAMEDPIMALVAAGYTDLLALFGGPEAYSYVFDGQLGYLDHALANANALGQVTGTTAWNINADEIPIFDYNDDIRDDGESSFERESGVLTVYAPDPFRSSDHDPVLVGLELDSISGNLTCMGLPATIIGTPGDDIIFGTNKADVIVTFGGHDIIYAGNGDDVICSGYGNDTIFGGRGVDMIDAGFGNDMVDGGNGDDVVYAGAGNDDILGGNGDDTLDGGADVDSIDGGRGLDLCTAGENVVACELS